MQKKKADENGTKDRTIIITPMALIDQWLYELDTHIVERDYLNILVYYTDNDPDYDSPDFERADVILTTMNVFWSMCGKEGKEWDDYVKDYYHQYDTRLQSGFFSRIVIDESHELKGKKCNEIVTFSTHLNIQKRWVLTGTPIDDDIARDLSSMCRFIGVNYSDYSGELGINDDTGLDLDAEEYVDKIAMFFTKIMLRRTKDQVFNEDNFPQQSSNIIPLKLNAEERLIYDEEKKMNKYQNKAALALDALRKLCNHPALIYDSEFTTSENVKKYKRGHDVLSKVSKKVMGKIEKLGSLLYQQCMKCEEVAGVNGSILEGCGHLFWYVPYKSI